jgi:hypothetical protein
MASQITHILAGEEALHRAAPELASTVLARAGGYFRYGCQGPDIFYHNQRTKPSGLHYGSLAHRREYGRIVEGALGAAPPGRFRPDEPVGAYLLGMATHAAVDRATHPFIVYFSGWHSPSIPGTERFRSCHPFFERLLDVALLGSLRGETPADFDIEALLAPPNIEEAARADEGIVALWAAGLRTAYPQAAGGDFLLERRIGNALIDGRYFYAITNPAVTALNRRREDWFAYLDDRVGYRSISLVYPDALPEGMDPMNLTGIRWLHPAGDGRSSTESYLDLVKKAVEDADAAIRLLIEAFARGEAEPGLAERIGNGGLSITDRSGLTIAPRVADPLLLAELMAAEYQRRLAWVRRLKAEN